jgi:cytochrome c peroxidase
LAEPKSVDQIGFPAELTRQAIPPDNPQTPDKTTLGEKLFFDGRLSADGTVACSACRSRPRFYRRQAHLDRHHGGVDQRSAPSILNALYNKTQFWDGRAKTLEDQTALPIVNPIEMGQPSAYATVIGDALRSRTEGRQTTEVAIAVASLNRVLELGRP